MATFNVQDANWLKVCPPKSLGSLEKALVEQTWDTETNQDVAIIERELASISKIKRMCIVKIFTFLPEAFIANLIYSRKTNAARRGLNKLYFKFLFNKITYGQFKKELLAVAKDDIILV